MRVRAALLLRNFLHPAQAPCIYQQINDDDFPPEHVGSELLLLWLLPFCGFRG